jgi:hypothetical protein
MLLSSRAALQHPRSLPDRQPDARLALDLGIEDLARLVERVDGPQHALDTLFVLGPLLDLVEVAVVGEERIVGLFGSALHRRRRRVLDLGPVIDSGGAVARIELFGDNALTAERAGAVLLIRYSPFTALNARTSLLVWQSPKTSMRRKWRFIPQI